MTLQDGIDTIHYTILHVLEKPLWKSKIRATLEDVDDLPTDGVPSVQTIGRRVDELHENDYIATSILSPDDVDRDLIIGYQRTKNGDKALEEKRDELLRGLANTLSTRTVTKKALIRMIIGQFDLNTDTATCMNDEYDEETLLSLLALHYAQKDAESLTADKRSHTHSTDDAQNFQNLLNE